MSEVESIGASSGTQEQCENMKKFVGTLSF